MKATFAIPFAFFLLVLLPSSASASPSWRLTELLGRAKTVALVTLQAQDGSSVRVETERVFRGAPVPGTLRLDREGAGDQLPEGVAHYLVLSQSRKSGPGQAAHLGQGLEGQSGYRGWLIYPIRRQESEEALDPAFLTGWEGAIRVDQLGELVRASPFTFR